MGRGKFDSGMKAVQPRDEGRQLAFSESPYHENVVDETPPSMWLVWCMFECVGLKLSEE